MQPTTPGATAPRSHFTTAELTQRARASTQETEAVTRAARAHLEARLGQTQLEAVRQHIVTLAWHHVDDDLLKKALAEVTDPDARRLLLFVYNAAEQLDDAGYQPPGSPPDYPPAMADAERVMHEEARTHRTLTLDNLLVLLMETAAAVEVALHAYTAGDDSGAQRFVAAMSEFTVAVQAIRDLFDYDDKTSVMEDHRGT